VTGLGVDLVELGKELINLVFQKVFHDFSQIFIDGMEHVIFGSDGKSPVGGTDIHEDI
jgi:hypothetical protein